MDKKLMLHVCPDCGGRLSAPDEIDCLVCMSCGEKYDYCFLDTELPPENEQILVMLEMQQKGSPYEFAMADAFVQADTNNKSRLWRFMPVYRKFYDMVQNKKSQKKSHPVTGNIKPMSNKEFHEIVKRGKS